MIDAEFLAIFLDEASEILERWEKSCLSLEKSPSIDTVNQIFRAAHNLKGSARSVGLDSFGEFVHKIEDYITKLKNQDIAITQDSIGLTLESQRELCEWIAKLRLNSEATHDVKSLTLKFEQALTACNQSATIQPPHGTPGHTENPAAITSSAEASLKPEGPTTELTHSNDLQSQTSTEVVTTASENAVQETKDIGTILLESGEIKPEQLEHALKLQHRKLGEVLVDSGILKRSKSVRLWNNKSQLGISLTKPSAFLLKS